MAQRTVFFLIARQLGCSHLSPCGLFILLACVIPAILVFRLLRLQYVVQEVLPHGYDDPYLARSLPAHICPTRWSVTVTGVGPAMSYTWSGQL